MTILPSSHAATSVRSGQRPTAPLFSRQLVDSLVVSLPLGMVGYLLWKSEHDCQDGFACLGDTFVAAAFTMLVAPTVLWVLLRLCKVPRAFLVSVAAVLSAHLLAQAVAHVQATRHLGLGSWDVPMAPWWAHLGVVSASALVGVVVAGRGGWGIFARVGVLLLVILVLVGSQVRLTYVETVQSEADLAAVEVTPYLPDLGRHSSADYASGRGDHVEISYTYRNDGEIAIPDVLLVPTTSNGPCADAETAGYHPGLEESFCRRTVDGFVADTGSFHYVGVVRGDTTLVAEVDREFFADDAVAEALRSAPRSNAAELARL